MFAYSDYSHYSVTLLVCGEQVDVPISHCVHDTPYKIRAVHSMSIITPYLCGNSTFSVRFKNNKMPKKSPKLGDLMF